MENDIEILWREGIVTIILLLWSQKRGEALKRIGFEDGLCEEMK